MTYSFDLKFDKPKETDLAGPPHAHVYIKTCSTDGRGIKFITPDCVSMAELDYEIERLHKELESIRKKAAQKFKKAKPTRSNPL